MAVLGCWRRRTPGIHDVLNVVPADRNGPADSLRPQRRDDAGRSTAPIVAGEDRTLENSRTFRPVSGLPLPPAGTEISRADIVVRTRPGVLNCNNSNS